VSAQSGRFSPFQGSDPFQCRRRRRWPRRSFRSLFEDLMEAHARIELAMLAALLNTTVQSRDGSPATQTASQPSDPAYESQRPSL
jgi:hypothetical protein